MFSRLSALAAVAMLASLSVPAAAAPSDVAALDRRGIFDDLFSRNQIAVGYCDDANFSGKCWGNIQDRRGCFDVPPEFNDQISSFMAFGVRVQQCGLYRDIKCSGPSITINGSISDLSTVYFDNVLSSYECRGV